MKTIGSFTAIFVLCFGLVLSLPAQEEFTSPEFDLSSGFITGDEIITASEYFDLVSEQYAQIEDYQALISITEGDVFLQGTMYHKRPDLLLIEFDEPEGQVISVDSERLLIYLPDLNVIMHQTLRKRESAGSTESVISMTTAEGLRLLKDHYSVAFMDTQELVPLEEGSEELVRKLKLEWRSIDEGFRQLTVSVGEDYLIRRIVGVTAGFEEMQIDFQEIIINQNLPEGRFVYDPPPDSNYISNFIFEPEPEEE